MLRNNRSHFLAIALIAAGALLGACGPAQPAGDPSGATTEGANGDGDGTTDGGSSTDGGDGPAAKGGETPAPALEKSTDLAGSKLLGDIKKLGFDPAKLPPLAKIKLGKKKKLMPLMQKSLGYDTCEGCHVEGDYKKETRNIRMARKMWDEYVVKLRDEKKGAIFCDSCHSGKQKVLARADKEAVNAFMEAHYENKLTRADGEDHSCSTCHNDEMETAIFAEIWGIE